MPDYDLNRMQADAVRRAREMQSRARTTNRQAPQQRAQNEPPEHTAPPPPEPQSIPAAQPVSVPEQQPAQPQPSLLDNLFQDRERTIILALLILLSGENANHELMFALMFLLM